jgi:tRNA pseudouridine55 synthase
MGFGLGLLVAFFGLAGSTVQLFGDALHPPEELGGTDEQGAVKQEGECTIDDVQLQPRKVRVDSIEIVRYAWPTLALKIDCGRGTYIRSIARDLGETLKVGGYLTESGDSDSKWRIKSL